MFTYVEQGFSVTENNGKRGFLLDNGGERDVGRWENSSKRPEYKTLYEC